MNVFRVLHILGQARSVPTCVDVEINSKTEWQMAKWLGTLPSFFLQANELSSTGSCPRPGRRYARTIGGGK